MFIDVPTARTDKGKYLRWKTINLNLVEQIEWGYTEAGEPTAAIVRMHNTPSIHLPEFAVKGFHAEYKAWKQTIERRGVE